MKQIKQNSTQIPLFTENFAKFLQILLSFIFRWLKITSRLAHTSLLNIKEWRVKL